MKAPFKLCHKRHYLAITAGLALAASPPAVMPAAAQATTPATTPASTATPAATSATTPATTTTPAAATTPAPVTTDSDASAADFTNWLTLGAGSTFVNGDKGEFKHEHDTVTGPYGGIEDFHGQMFVGKDGTFTVDGHGMFENHDYDIKLDLTDPNLGYVRAGYTEYRTWYDGTGGFYPTNGLSFAPYDNELYVDRGSAWIEAGLTLPNLPVFDVRYEHDFREGQMDSTSWGQTTLISGGAQAKIVPTFQGIHETRDIFQGDVKDKIDTTDADLGVRYEIDRSDDAVFIDQSPTQAANALITQNNLEKDDLFNVHGSTETALDKKVTLTSGFSVTTIGTELGGNRIYGPTYNSPLMPGFVNNGAAFIDLGGGGDSREYVGNLNAMWTPMANLVIVPAVRFEYEGSDLSDSFINTSGHGATFAAVAESANAHNWETDVAESLEARYTGFRDWSLYANAEWSQDWGNESWNSVPVLDTVNLSQDWDMVGQKYTVGANWYPLAQLNFGTQYYHEIHDYTYNNVSNVLVAQYPGYLQKQNFTTDDVNFRATWQALSTVSLITRYDFQYSTVDTLSTPFPNTRQAAQIQSAAYINHILSESITWTPVACLYLQVGGSYVINSMDLPMINSNNLVLSGLNNYWTVDASAGYEFDEETHLQVDYSYYNADDYINSAPASLPYGAGEVENSVTATLTRQLSKEVQASVKYGFYHNRDQTSGGQDNYDAQLVYISTQYRF